MIGSDYICIGCKKPVHWFCAVGHSLVNEGKGHSAHYWRPHYHAKKFAKNSRPVVQVSRAKPITIKLKPTAATRNIVPSP